MRRIAFWLLLGLSLSANVAVAAIAVKNGYHPRGAPGEPPIFSRVSLDPDQRARIVALREKLLEDREEGATRLEALRVKLADLLARDPLDRLAMDRTLVEIEARQAGFQRRVVNHVLAVRDLLRPEQRPAFFALVAELMRTGTPLDPTVPLRAQGGAPR